MWRLFEDTFPSVFPYLSYVAGHSEDIQEVKRLPQLRKSKGSVFRVEDRGKYHHSPRDLQIPALIRLQLKGGAGL